jgi:glycosyltransferase involved in cell wall biosynthesis
MTAAPDSRPLVSVVVPAYNEALRLMGSLTAIYEYLQGLGDRYHFELLIVDDGSTDETPAIAEAFAASRPEVRVLRHKLNFRLGQALRYAFSQTRGDYVVVFDSDLSYSVDHIGRMLETIQSQPARVVIASPYMKGGKTTAIPWRREVMSKGVNRLLAATSRSDVSTVTGMVRTYDGPFIRSLDLKSMGPEINTEILYKTQIMRGRVVEIPAHLDWSDQEERMRTRRVSLRVSTTSRLLMFSSFLFRPIMFFLVPGLILGIIALWTLGGVFLMVLEQFPATSGSLDNRITDAFARAYDIRPHSFIVGGIAAVIAVQLISLGVLAHQSKRYFEENYHLGIVLNRRLGKLEERVAAEASMDLGAGEPAAAPAPVLAAPETPNSDDLAAASETPVAADPITLAADAPQTEPAT